ncbi:MAG: RNA polymerase sigma factor [Thermoleophilia bacterium]
MNDGPRTESHRVGPLSSFAQQTCENLTEALQEQRSQTFERLYEDLHRPIYNLAARILGDLDEAADVTQDIFLTAFREMPALPQEADMKRWMYRVTVNACYGVLRKRRSRATTPFENLDEMPAKSDLLERSQLAHAVVATLADLNPRYRTALLLKDLHGFDNNEVADIMGISRSTAAVLLFRARAAFRRAFAKTSPVGAGPAAGLGLVALLPELPVPAALHTLPVFVDPVATVQLTSGASPAAASSLTTGTSPAATAPLWNALVPAASTPAATGALAKIGALLTSKVALLAIGASAVAGGGLAVDAVTHNGDHDISSSASPAAVVTTAIDRSEFGAKTTGRDGPTAEDGAALVRQRLRFTEALRERQQPDRDAVVSRPDAGGLAGSSIDAQRSGGPSPGFSTTGGKLTSGDAGSGGGSSGGSSSSSTGSGSTGGSTGSGTGGTATSPSGTSSRSGDGVMGVATSSAGTGGGSTSDSTRADSDTAGSLSIVAADNGGSVGGSVGTGVRPDYGVPR